MALALMVFNGFKKNRLLLLKGPQGPPGGIGGMGSVGEKVRVFPASVFIMKNMVAIVLF